MAGVNTVEMTSFSVGDFTRFYRKFEEHLQTSPEVLDAPLLHLIQGAFGYPVLSLSRYDAGSFGGIEVIGRGDTTSIKQSYYSYFQKRDPFAAYIGRAKTADPRTLTLKSSSVFQERYFSNEYYKYLSRYGLGWALAMPIGEYRLTVYRSVSANDFSDCERECMELLAHLIEREYGARRRLAPIAASCRLEGELLDSMDVGFVLLDRHGTIQLCNATARLVLGGKEDAQRGVNQVYRTVLQALGRQELAEPHEFAAPKRVAFCPVRHNGYLIRLNSVDCGDMEEQYYSLTIYRERSEGQPREELLVRQWGLSSREAEIALLLGGGMGYQEIADALVVSINTVRTHTCNIYRKLGVDSKRNLRSMLQCLG